MNVVKAVGMMVVYLFIYLLIQVLVGALFGIYYGIRATGVDGAEITSYITEQLAQGMGIILIVSIILTLLIYWPMSRKEGVRKAWNLYPLSWKPMLVFLVMGLSVGLLMGYVLFLFSRIDALDSLFRDYSIFSQQLLSGNFIILLLSVGILGPVFEEILFRGIVFNQLQRAMSLRAAFIVQAVAFGIYHMNPVQSVYAIVYGLLLGYAYLKFGSVLAPTAIHVGVNSLGVIAGQDTVERMLNANVSVSIGIAILVLVISIVMVVRMREPINWRPQVMDYEIDSLD